MGILSGMNKAQRKAFADDSDRRAESEEKAAREYRKKDAETRKKYGFGDSYAETNARICEANARDLRNSAKTVRKWWS